MINEPCTPVIPKPADTLHCVSVSDVHSVTLTENLQELHVWLELVDGGLVSVSLPVRELLARGHLLGASAPAGCCH